MEIAIRAALVAWLAADPLLAAQLNAIAEEAPSRTSLPWLAIAASASADWSCKTNPGREVRVALELHCRGDRPGSRRAIWSPRSSARIAALPRAPERVSGGHHPIPARPRRTARRKLRAILIEYRFRLLAG